MKGSDAGYSQACVEFTQQLALEEVPGQAREHLQLILLDWLGCAVGGTLSPMSAPARDLLDATSGPGKASAVCRDAKTGLRDAAFFNGYVGHILELDDTDRESITHPSTVVIPAALAVGEWLGLGGERVLEAVCAGYEVMLRIGAAMTPAHYAVWHTTSTSGVFGAAMAAGKLMGLTGEQLRWALGNAGTMAAGLWQFNQDGAMSKFLHTGHAASDGVLAAFLAGCGFTGAQLILEGSQGFFAGCARQEVDPAVFADFGERYRCAEVSIKPYPCCRHTHAAIDAAARLRARNDVAGIRQVTVRAYDSALSIAGNPAPRTPREAQFSLAYCVAWTLLHGPMTRAGFTEEAFRATVGHGLMSKITVVESPELTAMMPRNWPAVVEIERADGSRDAQQVDDPKGDPGNPVTWDEAVAKFAGLTREAIDENARERIVALCADPGAVRNCGQFFQVLREGRL